MIGLQDASVSFGARTLFAGISFTVPVGRSMAVLGPNGRGKTTLLRALLGFQPLVDGRRSAPKIAGYVPQHGASQAKLSGLEVVIMGRAARLGLFGQPSAEDRAAAEQALVGVGACDLAKLRYDRMSGGQRQMVLIARAIATGSPALIFDEPTSALDLGNQSRTLELLNSLRLRRDKAILFTTHDPNHALAAADDVLLMMPGGREIHGTVADMIEPDKLSELYGVAMRWVEVSGPTGETRRAILPAFAGIEAA
ncbi:ABC transporter ATP-binding protein [Neorhizobium galegae]|uniref:Iron compounds ABC transporter, ATP-binding protein n=1 Tax=Neorhizobium galegae bv. orientalis str. HAMBI 540 TaxID=1028800 RepID=A0A068T1I4_NEOGA|nr:ABC transporter ATP-binding protein [Neorhizobium galegae]MCQ1853512.1 ABC transporter ATP-binding protein [Neorhizobium galegae]CDN51355.1 Iron compounds ABC transporter, ATP-binding protein [Neorhizobium galegae bv. orientalis str. HAMBI 540]CDZ49633.1 Iron compounds ABC transporter, ATP-binding protein [Neorhizobium galegae bv. orientalis]